MGTVKVKELDTVTLFNLSMFMTRLEQSFGSPLKVIDVAYRNTMVIFGRFYVPAGKVKEFTTAADAGRIRIRASPSKIWIVNDPEENEILIIHVKSLTGRKEAVTLKMSLPDGMNAALRTGFGMEDWFSGEKEFRIQITDDVRTENLEFVLSHTHKQPVEGVITATILETGAKVAIPVRMGV